MFYTIRIQEFFLFTHYPSIGKLNILETYFLFFFLFKQTEPQQRVAGYSE